MTVQKLECLIIPPQITAFLQALPVNFSPRWQKAMLSYSLSLWEFRLVEDWVPRRTKILCTGGQYSVYVIHCFIFNSQGSALQVVNTRYIVSAITSEDSGGATLWLKIDTHVYLSSRHSPAAKSEENFSEMLSTPFFSSQPRGIWVVMNYLELDR